VSAPSIVDRFRGCLLGSAVGDALGAPVEFLSLDEIRRRFGEAGITDFDTAYGRRGAITDDTQMTLFTAEGLIRAHQRFSDRGICNVPAVIERGYLRWLSTQGEKVDREWFYPGHGPDGWLVSLPELHSCRAPGNTCLSALRAGLSGDSPRRNNSKGCGAVMRMAPVGLVAGEPFDLGCRAGWITHGSSAATTSTSMTSQTTSCSRSPSRTAAASRLSRACAAARGHWRRCSKSSAIRGSSTSHSGRRRSRTVARTSTTGPLTY
jgi:ADP-ribosylglycohydrolase